MKIAVDMLSLGFGGSETYAQEMLPRLASTNHEFMVLFTEGRGGELRKHLPRQIRTIDLPRRTGNPFYRYLYQKYAMPHWLRDNSIDVLFVPGGLTGTGPAINDKFKMVVMLRNMLPFDLRQRMTYPLLQYPYQHCRNWLLSRGLVRCFRAAHRTIFISGYCQENVAPLLGPVSSTVIPHGIGEAFHRNDVALGAKATDRLGIRKPFLLYVSPLAPYKHQLEVIEGFRRYREMGSTPKDLQLVLIGPPVGAYGRRVQNAATLLSHDVLCTGAVPRGDLPALMRNAHVLLFASTCEACPNIVLEYLAAGRPIISSRSSPMPEFGGEAAYYVDAENPAAWAEALGVVLGSAPLREQLSATAKRRASLYSWDETLRRTLAVLTEW